MSRRKREVEPAVERSRPMTPEERLVSRIMREYTAAFEGASEWAARVAGARGIMSGGAIAYEMDWSANAYRDAARASVCQEILTAMWHRIDTDSPLTTEKLRQEAYERVSRSARYPSRSTSVPSNLMAEERLSAWAEILEWAVDGGGWVVDANGVRVEEVR